MRHQQLHIVTINLLSSFNLPFSTCLSVSCCFSLAHTPVEGLLDTVSESLNSTWQGVASSNTANVTALLRSQTKRGVKIMKAHIWRLTLKMTSYLFSFSFHHFSHLLILRELAGCLLQIFAHNANGRFLKKKGVNMVKTEWDKHAVLYIKSTTTPVLVCSSEYLKCDTGGRVCVCVCLTNLGEWQKAKELGKEKPFVLCTKASFITSLSSKLFKCISSSSSLWFLPWNFSW